MNLSYIPGIALILIMALSSTPKTEATAQNTGLPAVKNVSVSNPSDSSAINPVNVEKFDPEHSDLDYKTIYQYITRKYRQIKEDDAKIISKYLVDYGHQHKLDPKFAAALIARESSFNRNAISETGAKGLGQIKDFNYPSLNIQDPFDIKQNVQGTVQYLKQMLSKWQDKSEKTELALASYYRGYSAVKKDNGNFDKKTNGYVTDIMDNYRVLQDIKQRISHEIKENHRL